MDLVVTTMVANGTTLQNNKKQSIHELSNMYYNAKLIPELFMSLEVKAFVVCELHFEVMIYIQTKWK